MVVEVGSEIDQFVFKIILRPKQHAIQILASKSADQPFHERTGQGNVWDGLDFCHLQSVDWFATGETDKAGRCRS